MNIIQTPSKNFSEREGYKPEIIVVHISTDTLKSMDSWFNTPNSQASAHYGISEDGSVVHQYVQEDKKAWHAGRVNNPSFTLYKSGVNPNLYSIGIENAGKDLSNATVEQIRTLCELIKDVAGRWNIPLDRDHIIGHFQIDAINRPNCPSPDHSVMDEIVALLKTEDTVAVPRKLLKELLKYV